MSRKKGGAVAIITVVAIIGGLAGYSSMSRQEPAPSASPHHDGQSDGPNESTTIAEDAQVQPPQGNGTVIANNTIITNKPAQCCSGLNAYVA